MSVPKIIHMMWFSGEDYPKSIKKCIDSWKEILPDYDIILWDKEKALSLNNTYVNEALESRKWAFAADVVRLYALFNYGGVYMDTDIFLKKRFDEFMDEKVALFQEYHKELNYYDMGIDSNGNRLNDYVKNCGIQAAFMISEKGNNYIKSILDYYDNKHFSTDANGKVRDNELIAPAIFAIQLEQYGYKYLDAYQDIGNGVKVFPSKYVAGHAREETKESFAIHYCDHSWYDFTTFERIKRSIRRRLRENPIIYKIYMKLFR